MAGMKPINVEILLSHNVGISNSYYKPTENELLKDYLQVVDLLTLDKQSKLQIELQNFGQKNKQDTLIIKGKLQEKDEEIKQLKLSYENDIDQIRQEMKTKFQELVSKIDLAKIS